MLVLVLCLGLVAASAPDSAADPAHDAYLIRLADALAHDDAYKVRLQAAVLLGRSGEARAVEPLLAALAHDADPTVRAAAATSLGALGDVRAIAPLMARLALDKESFVCEAAAAALRAYPRGRAMPYVMAAYGSEEPAVRRQVLLYLASEASALGEPVLMSALGDVPEVAEPAVQAVLALQPADALRLCAAASAYQDPAVRRGAAAVLRRLGTAEAARLLLEIYERDVEVEDVRRQARAGLRELRRFVAPAPYVASASSGDKHARAHALRLLGVLGGEPARAAIVAALASSELYLRGTAVMAAGDLGDRSLIAALETLAAEPQNARIAHLIRHTLAQLRDIREQTESP